MTTPTQNRATPMLDALQAQGYRLTEPRRTVIDVLVESEHHLDHATILALAHERSPQLGRATVYRTLDLLASLGLIHVTSLGDGGQRFCVPTGGHHHHLICNRCGSVMTLEQCFFDSGLARVEQETAFQVDSHLVELYGICPECQERR